MCRPLFILARHCRTNLKLRIASSALVIKINFVRHCDRFYFCRKLCQTEMMIVSVFRFFTIEKREFLQHVFLYVAPQSAINRISTSTPRSTLHYHSIQTTLLCQHYISMSHTYQYRKHITSLQSTINPITRYYSYTKISLYATSFPRRFHATTTTLERCTSDTILPVSSQLDLRFNSTELSKIIVRAVLLSQLNCIFLNHQP